MTGQHLKSANNGRAAGAAIAMPRRGVVEKELLQFARRRRDGNGLRQGFSNFGDVELQRADVERVAVFGGLLGGGDKISAGDGVSGVCHGFVS